MWNESDWSLTFWSIYEVPIRFILHCLGETSSKDKQEYEFVGRILLDLQHENSWNTGPVWNPALVMTWEYPGRIVSFKVDVINHKMLTWPHRLNFVHQDCKPKWMVWFYDFAWICNALSHSPILATSIRSKDRTWESLIVQASIWCVDPYSSGLDLQELKKFQS